MCRWLGLGSVLLLVYPVNYIEAGQTISEFTQKSFCMPKDLDALFSWLTFREPINV